jgi:hypothetical protein
MRRFGWFDERHVGAPAGKNYRILTRIGTKLENLGPAKQRDR